MESHLLSFAKPASKDQIEKISLVNQELKNCDIDVKLTADRVFVSLFQQDSRDQISKFASPQVNLSFYKDKEETGFEIFGFNYQQSTDIPAFQLFANNLYTQVEMLA